MVDQRKVEALLNAQAKASVGLLTRLHRRLRPALVRLGDRGMYVPADYVPAAQQMADASAAAQRARAAVSGKFTQQVLHVLGEDVKTPPVDVANLRGVDPVEVWQRPMKEYRYQLSQGKTRAEALAAATARAESIADDDLQLADRKAAQDVMAASKRTVGYRRVIHPELSAGGTCGLCVAASTRLYKVAELRAIHARCHCVSIPVTKADDLGHVLNTYDLRKLYGDNAGSTDSAKLKYTRYQVNEHGELGPVLRRKGDNFRDASDVAHDLNRPTNPAPTNLDALPRTRDEAVAQLQVLLRQSPRDASAIRLMKQQISRLNRAA